MDPADLTAIAARARIAAGQLTPAALMEACLARIAEREPTLHAMAYLDPALARLGAARARPGALHGLPLGVKDVLDTADMVTEYNSPIWKGHQPRADAGAVAWARAAGAVVVGKTVTTEFATRTPGPTTNPHNPAHTPGGSSSGSAAGVAAGYFPFAFGTQTAGSVIRPAAYCGVVGYKPTYGTIERHGMKLMSFSLDTIGVMARTVADCALLAGAVSGRDLGDPEQAASRPWRIGLCRSHAWDNADAATQTLLLDAATRLRNAGAVVSDIELPPLYTEAAEAHALMMLSESARAMAWELMTARDQLSPALQERLEWGLTHTAEAADAARATFDAARRGFADVTSEFDVLLTPSAPGEAPLGIEWTGEPSFNSLWTGLHVPCVTVPAGMGPAGLPLGLQIVGRQGEDSRTLAAAHWIGSVAANH
ncbi:amidase [Acidisphaera sp. L21]|uniref:amidase n=1 Tax=Acidisphaera sp. L21 TaxID=1641851 RepID=UPI00131A9B9C|nr:amidase [Acidisphaera sp. L21]